MGLQQLDILNNFEEEAYRNLTNLRDAFDDPSSKMSDVTESRDFKTITNDVPRSRQRVTSLAMSNNGREQYFFSNYMSLNKEANNKMIREAFELGQKNFMQEDFVEKLGKEDITESSQMKSFEDSGYAENSHSKMDIEFDIPKAMSKAKRNSIQAGDNLIRTQPIMKVKNFYDLGFTSNLNRIQALKRYSLTMTQNSNFFDRIRQNKARGMDISFVENQTIVDTFSKR